MSELKCTKAALEAARVIARRASKNDSWMRPVFEKGNPVDDFGNFQQCHREGWEGTTQWICQYYEPLKDLAYDQQDRFGLNYPENSEDFDKWYSLLSDLKDAFWDEWEEKVDLLRVWNRGRKRVR